MSLRITFTETELKYIHYQVRESCKVQSQDIQDKLIFACLELLRVRIAKRLLIPRAKYAFTFKPHEALAFTLAYRQGFLATDNLWANTLLQSTHDTLHQALI